MQQMGPAGLYPEEPSSQWLPPQQFSKLECMMDQVFLTDVYLTRLYSERPDMSDLTQEQRDFVEKSTSGILKLHKVMIEHVTRQIQTSNSIERFTAD